MTDHDFRQLPPTVEPPHPHKQGDLHNGAVHFWCNLCSAHLLVMRPAGAPMGPVGPYKNPAGPAHGVNAEKYPTCEAATAICTRWDEDDSKREQRAAEKRAREEAIAVAFFTLHPQGWY